MTYVEEIGKYFVVMIESIGLMGDYQLAKFKSENVANEYSRKANKKMEKFDKRIGLNRNTE
jgi:hypothetical protein